VEGAKFCTHCGAPVEEETWQGNPGRSGGSGGKKILLLSAAIAAAFLVVACCSVFAVAYVWGGKKETAAEGREEAHQDLEETAAARDEIAEGEKEMAGQESPREENGQETERPEEDEADFSIPLIAVPVATMSLRQEPGLSDESVIREIATGERMLWNGEMESAQERDFYRVMLEDGAMGFVAADYCTPYGFDYDESALDIVDTSKELYSYEEMLQDIGELEARYPQAVQSRVMGESVDGRDLVEVILGNPEADNQIMVQAAIHGREYMTSLLVMKMTEYYAHYYEDGEYNGVPYRDLLEQTGIRIVPMANPDGVTISQYGAEALYNPACAEAVWECYERDKEDLIYREDGYGYLYWQDIFQSENFDRYEEGYDQIISFAEYERIWKANANGVDLNRNFDVGWEEMELREQPSYGSFKGWSPVSEPETQALVTLAKERDYEAYISYHSRGQLIYMDTEGNTQEVSDRSRMLAEALRELNRYSLVDADQDTEAVMGGFGDWIQLNLQEAGCTVEVGKGPCPLDISEFPSIWNRNRETWARLCSDLYF